MFLFNHKVSLTQILNEIPDAELTRLADASRVDYCSKVLTGKLVFYLFIYVFLQVDRLSQRGLTDAFSSPMFKLIFDTKGRKRISHSSISERLSVIELDFFECAYACIYGRLSSLYTKAEIEKLNLNRVDSTLVAEVGNKLSKGMICGNEHKKKKMIKYTINFDGMFASFCRVHSTEEYACESLALPENIMGHFKKEKDHATVYLFDRGMNSGTKFSEMKNEEGLLFVGRLQESRKLKYIKSLSFEYKEFKFGDLQQDDLVQIYTTREEVTRKGTTVRKSILQPEHFRVIRFKSAETGKIILLITNILDLPAETVAQMYKHRWDIEVFFRFLKQELNFSHFLSLNENGMQVVLYMTLITAMLVMIYKKENQIGYKTAVRRLGIELENLVLAIVVIQSGGDLRKVDLPDP